MNNGISVFARNCPRPRLEGCELRRGLVTHFVMYRLEARGLVSRSGRGARFASLAVAKQAAKLSEALDAFLTSIHADHEFPLADYAAAAEAAEGTLTVAGISRAYVREMEIQQNAAE